MVGRPTGPAVAPIPSVASALLKLGEWAALPTIRASAGYAIVGDRPRQVKSYPRRPSTPAVQGTNADDVCAHTTILPGENPSEAIAIADHVPRKGGDPWRQRLSAFYRT